MLKLVQFNIEDVDKEYTFLKELESENGFNNPYYGMTYDEFVRKIPSLINDSLGIDLKPELVPQNYYFLYDDDIIVGLYKVRHYLNEALKEGSGHIGYGIQKAYRGKGYASKGLALALTELKKIMPDYEDEIYMACHVDNPASLKVQLHNGAYIHHSDGKEFYTRIKK